MTQKVMLVVGGAAGIGKDFVLDAVQKGNKVVFTDLNETAGAALLDDIGESAGEAIFFQHDITDLDNTKDVINKAVSAFGKIDVLVHSAGMTSQTAWEELTLTHWRKTFEINLTGLFYTIRTVLPVMLDNQHGKIVIIGSGSATTGSGGGAHYSASKGGALGLMRSIAAEYSHQGININIVAPRVIQTQMLDKLYPTTESKQVLIDKIPTKRIGTMEDTTHAINFLIDDQSSYIQGQVLLLDGGRTYLA